MQKSNATIKQWSTLSVFTFWPHLNTRRVGRRRRSRNGFAYLSRILPAPRNVSDFVQKHFAPATNVSQFAQPKKRGQQSVHNNVSSFTTAFRLDHRGNNISLNRSAHVYWLLIAAVIMPTQKNILTMAIKK